MLYDGAGARGATQELCQRYYRHRRHTPVLHVARVRPQHRHHLSCVPHLPTSPPSLPACYDLPSHISSPAHETG